MIQISEGLIALLGIIIFFGIVSRPQESKKQRLRHQAAVGAEGQRSAFNAKLTQAIDNEAANTPNVPGKLQQQGAAKQAVKETA